ncbi:hypothetical protein JZ785_03725 [Alicyclobacillus curvatus]|nr:hypothetical protein JZ785_03725 [Alicyclobacillus curvatus]
MLKLSLIVAGLSVATITAITACGTSTQNPTPTTSPSNNSSSSSPTNSAASSANSSSNATSTKTVSLTMKMETGKMDGKKGWPKFSPADTTLPANAVMTVTVLNYDDGNATIPSGDNKVTGTINTDMTVDGKTVTSVKTADVAHTITIPSIGLNVPIPVRSSTEKYNTITFSFKTPSTPGQLDWQCMASCGSGSSGWGGAMSTDGWMKGVFTVK